MTEVKYSFFDQIFSVSSSELKDGGTGVKYLELAYPSDNSIPVLKYAEKNYLPIRIIIKSATGETDIGNGPTPAYDYVLVLETVSRSVSGSDENKLFVRMKLKHDNAATSDGPLTPLFNAVAGATAAKVMVPLNGLLNGMSQKTGIIYKHSSSGNSTLYLDDFIATKLNTNASAKIMGQLNVSTIMNTFSPVVSDPPPVTITMTQTTLTQRQVCRRATDNASPSVSVVTPPKIPNVQTNVLVLTIIGLCMAAFFPSIYSIMVCLPAGKSQNYYAVHMVYLIGILGIVITLFVRGFREGDAEAQIWGVGLIVIFLIFFWKYFTMSAKNMLQCGLADVQPMSIVGQFGQFFSAEKKYISVSFIIIMTIITVLASVYSNEELVFKIYIASSVILIAVYLFLYR